MATLESVEHLVTQGGSDLVLVDQRGAGLSYPRLDCDEYTAVYRVLLEGDLAPDQEASLWAEAARQCAQRLRRAGLTLSAFDTVSAATDLEALRRALGYSRWDMVATSYAANLALAFARDFPGSVRSLVLDSPLVPDADDTDAPETFERALAALFDRCQRRSRCHREFPDPAASFDQMLARLAATPLEFDVSGSAPWSPLTVRVTPRLFLEAVHVGMYSADRAHELPRLLSAADRGDLVPLANLVEGYASDVLDPDYAYGLLDVIACREFVPFTDWARVEREAATHRWRAGFVGSALVAEETCRAWDVGTADPRARELGGGDHPVLILAGRMDPTIPLDDAIRVADHLPRSRLFEFPATGHDVLGTWWCASELVVEFLVRPDSPLLDSLGKSCLQEANSMEYVLPSAPEASGGAD